MEKYNDTVVIDENTYIEEYLPEDLEEDFGSDDIYYIDEDTGNSRYTCKCGDTIIGRTDTAMPKVKPVGRIFGSSWLL